MPLPRPLADAVWAVRFRFCNRFRRRLAVLRCDRPADAGGGDRNIEVRRFGPGDALPGDFSAALAAAFGREFHAVHAAEADGGSTLWVGLLDGGPAGFARTKPGDRVTDWHERLAPDDRLIYAMATRRAARGRGVGTAALRAALGSVPAGGAAWADTMIWNAPALAALRKAGFRPIYEADPLPDHPD